MIDTLSIFEELKENFEPSAAKKLAELLGKLYTEITNTVTKAEFKELRDIVANLAQSQNELAEAQKSSEARLTRLEQTVQELTEAQKSSEKRLTRLEEVVEELAQAQKRTEQRVEELAQAQKRTEQRVEELAQAQKRTEQRVEELAQAQKRTEQELQKLAIGLKDTQKQVGGLSDTIGYTLENQAYKYLPSLLQRDYGVTITTRLKRGYLEDARGHPIEINILGEATKDGKSLLIIGECKSRLSKKNIKEFVEKRMKMFPSRYGEIFPVIVTHMISEPDAEDYAKEKGVALYYSYDFE